MRRRMLHRPIVLVWFTIASVTTLAGQQDTTPVAVDPEKAAAIRSLFEVTQTAQMTLVGIERAMQTMETKAGLPPEWSLDFKKRASQTVPVFLEMLVPVYDAEFSLPEIRQLLEFYETPIGRAEIDALADVLPEFTRSAVEGIVLTVELMLEFAKRGASLQPGVGAQPSGKPVEVALVDEPPELLTHPPLVYPDSLRQAGFEGVVQLEFVIDTAGHVDPVTIRIISAAHPAFVPAAKEVFRKSLYRPGRIRGIPVRVLVRQSVTFSIQKPES